MPAVASFAVLAALAAPQQPGAALLEPSAASLASSFTDYDQDGDGQLEIAAVEVVAEVGAEGPQVLVLVEDRLLRTDPDKSFVDLLPHVRRLAEDLAAEGRRSIVLRIALAASDVHQDGRYVLAMRELLRAFAGRAPVEAALLLGHFPDALVVRTCNWRKRGDVTLRRGQADEAVHRGVAYLRRIPEDVAHRADVVMGDLDGAWHDVYVRPRTRLETVQAVFAGGVPRAGGTCVDLERGGEIYEDFFLVSDGKCEIAEELQADGAPTRYRVLLDDRSADHECCDTDRCSPNVLARPEVLVSRIDARGVALRPRGDVVGVAGEGLLDARGLPQAVRFADAAAVPAWSSVWEHDPAFERRLLADFLDRNHAYRTGVTKPAWRTSSLACELGSGFGEMSKAGDGWEPVDASLSDIAGEPPLQRAVEWFAFPAVLRTLRAHSDPWGSVFARGNVADLERAVGGPIWSWTRQDDRLEPSLAAACGGGKLDWFLLQNLWRNGVFADGPSFYHHTGCHGISPPGAMSRTYDHPGYGLRQGAESLLMFGNGLALVGRSKVFYDEPRGFARALAKGETFGAAWARYFEVEAAAASWEDVGGDIGRKRAYFWSVLGDCTLRLRRP